MVSTHAAQGPHGSFSGAATHHSRTFPWSAAEEQGILLLVSNLAATTPIICSKERRFAFGLDPPFLSQQNMKREPRGLGGGPKNAEESRPWGSVCGGHARAL